MNNNERSNDKHKGRHTFVTKIKLGVCPCCVENVYDNQLFVEEQKEFFHYSCYNEEKAKGKN